VTYLQKGFRRRSWDEYRTVILFSESDLPQGCPSSRRATPGKNLVCILETGSVPAHNQGVSFNRIAAFAFLICSLALLNFPAVQGKSASAPAASDGDYVSALAAANHFLHAWQNQDREIGLAMLSDEAKHGSSEEYLQNFFSPGAEAAYEISHGKKIKAGCYLFPIALFGTELKSAHAHASEIVVVQTGKDDWAVDKLP
jgi:hypothetical protein